VTLVTPLGALSRAKKSRQHELLDKFLPTLQMIWITANMPLAAACWACRRGESKLEFGGLSVQRHLFGQNNNLLLLIDRTVTGANSARRTRNRRETGARTGT
jgi:hypothetical protein